MDAKDNVEDGFDEVASLDEQIDVAATALPTDADGRVPKGLLIRMSRPDKSHGKHGIVFTVEEGGKREAVLFAHQQSNAIYSASKQEIVFHRGFTDGEPVGHANFHHWIADQSKSIIVQNAAGEQTDVRRKTMSSTHNFEANGRRLYWQRARGDSNLSKLTRPHLECVDDDDSVYAFYSQEHRYFSSGKVEKTMGEVEIRKEGLTMVEVETMLMAMTAVWVKRGKRMIQGSQAGIAGGLVTSLSYIIGG